MMLSVVIPLLNERESLEELVSKILEVNRLKRNHAPVEILLIDDGSSDGSWEVIESLAGKYPEVMGLRFRRNFGKAAALSAGFGNARGEFLVSLGGFGLLSSRCSIMRGCTGLPNTAGLESRRGSWI